MDEVALLERAIELALANVHEGGRPFGALVVDEGGEVLATGVNRAEQDGDPTAHAELLAIREASRGREDLRGCTVIASAEPCPMCQAAARVAKVVRMVYAAPADHARAAGLAAEGPQPQIEHVPAGSAAAPFDAWATRKPG